MSAQHGHQPAKQDPHDVHDTLDHIVSPRIYIIVGATLLVFTGITVWASYLELGIFNPIVALLIAVVKATIVVLFFMHVKYTHEKLTPLVIVSAIFFLFILLGLSMADYATRLWR